MSIEGSRGVSGIPVPASEGGTAPVGNTWFVDNVEGDDANAGDRASLPVKTIAAAIALASSGDLLDLAAGAYAEAVALPAGVDLTGPGAVVTGNFTLVGTNRIEVEHIIGNIDVADGGILAIQGAVTGDLEPNATGIIRMIGEHVGAVGVGGGTVEVFDTGSLQAHEADNANPHAVTSIQAGVRHVIRDAIPVVVSDTVRSRIAFPMAVRIVSIAIMNVTKSTLGTYVFSATKKAGALSMLLATPYDMMAGGFVAGDWTELDLHATASNRELAANGEAFFDFVAGAGVDAAGVQLRVTALEI